MVRELADPPPPPASAPLTTLELLSRLQSLVDQRRDLEQDIGRLQEESGITLKDLQAKLAAGESTGDPLRDLVLQHVGFDPLFEGSARTLDGELAGKKGEFVLLHFEASTPFRHTLTETSYRSANYVRMGVLDGEHLVSRTGIGILTSREQITLPVSQYIQVVQTMMFEAEGIQVKPERGNIFFAHGIQDAHPPELEKYLYAKRNEQATALGLPLPRHSLFASEHMDRRESKMHQIVIGDKLVMEWLKKHHMMGLYKPAAIALSKLILEPTEG